MSVATVAVDDVAEEVLITYNGDIAFQVNKAPGGVQVVYGGGVYVELPYISGDGATSDTFRIPAPGVAAGATNVRWTQIDEILDDNGVPYTLPPGSASP